jgi:hypothetical protein
MPQPFADTVGNEHVVTVSGQVVGEEGARSVVFLD